MMEFLTTFDMPPHGADYGFAAPLAFPAGMVLASTGNRKVQQIKRDEHVSIVQLAACRIWPSVAIYRKNAFTR